MELSNGDKLHPLWAKLVEHITARLARNRVLLEGPVTEKEADQLRGRIAENKLFLSLEDEVPTTLPNMEL